MLMTSAAVAVAIALPQQRWRASCRSSLIFVVHDRRQHRRAAGRHPDRRLVHRRDHRLVARLAGAAIDRDPDRGRGVRRDARAASSTTRSSGRPCASSPAGPTPAGPRSTRASSRRRSDRTICQDDLVLFLEVSPGDASEFSDELARPRASTSAATACCAATSPAIPNAIAGLLLDLRDRTDCDPARVLRLDGRQSDRVPAQVPGVRRRRHGAGLPRGPAQGRAGPERRPRIHVGLEWRLASTTSGACSSRSSNSACATLMARRASSIEKNATRSISGISMIRPERGGHSVVVRDAHHARPDRSRLRRPRRARACRCAA